MSHPDPRPPAADGERALPEEIASAIEGLVNAIGYAASDDGVFLEDMNCDKARSALTTSILSRLTAAEAGREAHRIQLQEALDEIDRLRDPTLRHMRLENGEINMAVAGPMVEQLALAMTGWFRESGAENYVEMNLNARDNSDDRYCVTVQKVWAKSPHQLRAEAEAARDAALARVEKLEKALGVAQSALAMLTEPNEIRSTSVANAWAVAVDAELKCRQALTEAQPKGDQ